MIHDCSRPSGSSLNNFWNKEPFKYTSIQDAVDKIKKGFFLAKLDLSSAFRSVRIKADNYTYCGLEWTFTGNSQPTLMVDTRLPFGARRSPFIFNELTQAVIACMRVQGFPNTICYLDDFLCIENSKERCAEALNTLLKMLRRLGFSINYSKIEGPVQKLTFLGIELDTNLLTLQLSKSRLEELSTILKKFSKSKKVTKHQLQQLAGKLQFATQCIYGGRFFLRRVYDAIASLSKPWHRIRLNLEVYKDIAWWRDFIAVFNGKMDIIDCRPLTPMYTDACSKAAGATYNKEFV